MEEKNLSLYAGGMSQRDISEQIKELCHVEISPELVSKICEKRIQSNSAMICIKFLALLKTFFRQAQRRLARPGGVELYFDILPNLCGNQIERGIQLFYT